MDTILRREKKRAGDIAGEIPSASRPRRGGIAVGLSSKILPHNFNEILDAAIAYLHNEPFSLLPDFQTGGLLDASRYNDGARGGQRKSESKNRENRQQDARYNRTPIRKKHFHSHCLYPVGNGKGKIKIRKVDDNTAATAEILVHLIPGTSSDKAIDALYAFTDCEVSISPNCLCVIADSKPQFLSVSDLLKHSVVHTRELLRRELEIKLAETKEAQLYCSLEKIFIEERIYKDKEVEEAADMNAAIAHVDKRLEPFKPSFFREVTQEDLIRLWEIKMGRILKFNTDKANRHIADLQKDIERLQFDLDHMVEYTIAWYAHLKEKYGDSFPRRTVLRGFDSIEAAKVAEANKRLYYDKTGGFLGTSLKDNDFLFTCSDIDDILIIYRGGTYKLVKVQDKLYVGKKIIHIGLFKKGDKRTIYNVIYRHGKPALLIQRVKTLATPIRNAFSLQGLRAKRNITSPKRTGVESGMAHMQSQRGGRNRESCAKG